MVTLAVECELRMTLFCFSVRRRGKRKNAKKCFTFLKVCGILTLFRFLGVGVYRFFGGHRPYAR